MKAKNLKANKNNPRKMSAPDKKGLKYSVLKYGDLGCIIMNRKTKSLITGHQRVSVIPKDAEIFIENEYDEPTEAFTVAEGYILVNGERFKYREVDAPLVWEREALIASNAHSGEWDEPKLKPLLLEFEDLDYEGIGFSDKELVNFGVEIEEFGDLPEEFDNGFNDDPTETDAQYLKKNKGQDTEIRKENLPNTMKKSFTNKDETPAPIKEINPNAADPFQEPQKKRHIVIVEFDEESDKKEFRKSIKTTVKKMNGYFV